MEALIVSTALDTNGQNYRYAEAAKRWGADPDVLKSLVVGKYDPADVGGRFRVAAEKLGGLAIRTAHMAEAYFDFPRDIRWSRSTQAEVQQLADECDVIHLNNSEKAYIQLRMPKVRKPGILHHHGTLFRGTYGPALMQFARRFNIVQAVSTIDLQRRAPEILHWLPTAYDLDALAVIAAENRREPDGKVRVVSAPTNREIKSTALLQAAIAQLQAEGLPVELVLIENRPWAECLAIKATADIYFDQVKLGYGCNAIEAWGMNIPVIAGADEWTLERMTAEFGRLPFYTATEETIADAIRAMVQSSDLRAEWAGIGREHNERFHAEKSALSRLAELYGLALKWATEGPGSYERFPSEAGLFQSVKPKLVVRIGSRTVNFVDGEAKVDDPELAKRLRHVAMARPGLKISEVPI